MYDPIIATDMLTLRGSHDLERMDDKQLADLGIERQGNVFVLDGEVVYQVKRFEILPFVGRIVAALAAEPFHSARA